MSDPGPEVTASPPPRLGLFVGYGVEIEYMIVDRDSLDIRPVADRLLKAVAGQVAAEVEFGPMAWSNELALHLLELKTNGPAPSLGELPPLFRREVARAEAVLSEEGCALLPGGMHPWMDPRTETYIWPHEFTEVYRTFDRIFSCRGHGWANLQSTHLNLPFADDREFVALHASIRALLPLLPALAASSPFLDGKVAGALDHRLVEYARNARRVPSVTGAVIPDSVCSVAEYRETILGPIYHDLAPLDPEGNLRHEWVNARGAIARFDRGAIEIRVLDPQECPTADFAILGAVSSLLRRLVARWFDGDERIGLLPTDRLAELLRATCQSGEAAIIDHPPYLEALEVYGAPRRRRAAELWEELLAGRSTTPVDTTPRDAEGRDPLETILSEGTLARRILRRSGRAPSRARLRTIYHELRECLSADRTLTNG